MDREDGTSRELQMIKQSSSEVMDDEGIVTDLPSLHTCANLQRTLDS